MGLSNTQSAKVTAALGVTYEALTADCVATLRTAGVLDGDRWSALPWVDAPEVGDLVAVYAHGQVRVAKVWAVTPTKLSAVYVTPTVLDESIRFGQPAHPHNITARQSEVRAYSRRERAAASEAVEPTTGGGAGSGVLEGVTNAGALPFHAEDCGLLF